MSEEIIIDGVNVAGCPDLKQYNDTEGNLMCMEYIDGGCEGHNCYYKQLQRLKVENEELKEYIKDLQVRKDRYYLQVLEYEKQISDWISFYIKVRDIISGNYEIL